MKIYSIYKIDSQHITEYTEAVCSDWYNEYQLNKYDGVLDKRVIAQRILDDADGRYMIVDENNNLVGGIAEINMFSEEETLSYFVLKQHQGKGIATEVLNRIKRVAYRQCKRDNKRLCMYIMEDNIASKHVAEKCGFKVISSDGKIARYEYTE